VLVGALEVVLEVDVGEETTVVVVVVGGGGPDSPQGAPVDRML
jgi:hypothetical protein